MFEWIPLCCSKCHKWEHKTNDCWSKRKAVKVWKPTEVNTASRVTNPDIVDDKKKEDTWTLVKGKSGVRSYSVERGAISPSRFAVLAQGIGVEENVAECDVTQVVLQ